MSLPLPSLPDLDLDYDRYARWLQRSCGKDLALLVCDAAGTPCWSAPQHDDLPAWLAGLAANGFAWGASGDGMQRHDAGDATLLYVPVTVKGKVAGWVGVREAAPDGGAPFAWDALAEGLEDVAAALGDEARRQGELD